MNNRTVEQSPEQGSSRLGSYASLIIRQRWWVILSAFCFWAIGLGVSILAPAKFRSETVILIEPEKVLPQYVAPNVAVDIQQRMQSLTQQILSRTRLLRIIDSLHVYGTQSKTASDDVLVQRMRNDITIELIKGGGRGDELSAFKVSYSAPTPALAQAVVGQITSLFIDENLRNQQQLSEDTTAFLDSQLAEARKDLERQEQLLGAFRSKYIGELPEQLSSNVQILSGLQSRLQSATAALHQAEQQRLYLGSLIGQSKGLQSKDSVQDDPASAGAGNTQDEQIEKMRAELAALTARYTPEHPDVVRLKEQIANAEAMQRVADRDPRGRGNGTQFRSGNAQTISPLAQLESQLKANELEIANRQQEVKGLENQIEQYQARLNLTPIREQELADVERNHQQSRTNYDSLLAKKLQSEMATDLAKRQQGQQFSVIDPPSLPQHPYWPNPLQFSLCGLLVGLAIALGAIVFPEISDPRVRSEKDMREWFANARIVASIPFVATEAEQRHRSWRYAFEILAAFLIAVSVPAVTLFTYWKR